MARHFMQEIERLKKMVFTLSALVEESVHKAVNAIERRDAALAQRVIDNDIEIDQMEVDVEEECLKILALHQPVAADLRYIIAMMKLNSDLERIGDLAVNTAKRAVHLANHPYIEIPPQIPLMAEKAQAMLKRTLDALVNGDSNLARQVMASDDEVDALHREAGEHIKRMMKESPDLIDDFLQLFHAARHLERISDHASNIAEDVIYLIEGEIVRHKNGVKTE
jgi:phosphate transport system protein